MHPPRYRNRFTLYRYAGAVLVCCDRCHGLVNVVLDPEDALWEAAVHAVRGEG